MKLIVTDQNGKVHELEALEGWRAMEVIRDWGLNIRAECGGACACATCHVYVDADWVDRLAGPSEDEDAMMDLAGDVADTSRLACQILMTDELDGLRLTLAASAARDAEAA